MRCRRPEFLLMLAVVGQLLFNPELVFGSEGGVSEPPPNLKALLLTREPEVMLSPLKEGIQETVQSRWAEMVTADAQIAAIRNREGLYANPSLQAYVNRLGQSIIPSEIPTNLLVSFKIVEDPLPYGDSLSTGTVYLSSGIISLLDNESQLAFLLLHEAGHVILSHHLYEAIEEVKAEKQAQKIKIGGAAAGIILGDKLAEGLASQLLGGYLGYKGSKIGLSAAEPFRNRRFLRSTQLEADRFAAEVMLRYGFDAREAPVLMDKIGNIIQRSSAEVSQAFGNPGDLPLRSAKLRELLGGALQPAIDRTLQGDGFRMSSPRFGQLMAEAKRDNGLLALGKDLFAIARENLEEASAVRTDDPLTMYGLGMLYRAIGRSNEDYTKAASHLKSSMEFDEVGHRYPEAFLQYAVELLSREDPQYYPEVQKTLKKYVALYQRKTGGELPREMRFVYDYLDVTGDSEWLAYAVMNVNSRAPYQFTGDTEADKRGTSPEKQSPK